MPNVPETAIAMMATTAIGAVWSSAAPEFGVKTVIERFSQIEPKVLFAADGYRFGGKDFGREAEVRRIVDALPRSEEHTSELQSLMSLSYAVFFLNNKIPKSINIDVSICTNDAVENTVTIAHNLKTLLI